MTKSAVVPVKPGLSRGGAKRIVRESFRNAASELREIEVAMREGPVAVHRTLLKHHLAAIHAHLMSGHPPAVVEFLVARDWVTVLAALPKLSSDPPNS